MIKASYTKSDTRQKYAFLEIVKTNSDHATIHQVADYVMARFIYAGNNGYEFRSITV